MSMLQNSLRRCLTAVGAIALTLFAARIAHANVISSSAYLFPGFLPMDPIVGGLGTILAAILERPFLTYAGIDRNTLRFSLRANYLSLLVGFIWLVVMLPPLYSVPWLYLSLSVVVSIAVEGAYLRSAAASRRHLNWPLVIAGNLISAFVLVAISVGTSELRETYRFLPRRVEPHLPTLYVIGGVTVAIGLVIALWPMTSEDSAIVSGDERTAATDGPAGGTDETD